MTPTYLIRPAPALYGKIWDGEPGAWGTPVMTEVERRAALGALDRIEATLGQDEFSDIGPVDTGAFVSPSDFDLPSAAFGALPYGELTPSTGGEWTDILIKLLPAAGSAAAAFFHFPTTTGTPAYGAVPVSRVPAPSTGIPWWGWALIGAGGLGALGVGFALLRRLF